jgi:L-asparaginase
MQCQQIISNMSDFRPSLLMIYTGGTIGMVKDYSDGSLRHLSFTRIMDAIPELSKANYDLTTITFETPFDSSNANPEEWVRIAKIVEENYNKYDGFVILHGTDTMAYSASVLSFMLENLKKPVIFTGSQLPIGSLRTDAKENLISALELAASFEVGKPVVPEVCIVFQNQLFRGNRTSKYNAEEFKAFRSYNYPPLAEIGVHIRFNYHLINKFPAGELKVHTKLCTDVAIIKMFPGISEKVVNAVLGVQNLKGIVLETYGAGNAPNAPWFIDTINKAIENNIIIYNVTQCSMGRVEMGMYKTSVELEKAGVVDGRDITTEAAITKLMYVLGNFKERDKVLEELNKPLRGEITV